MPVPETKMTQSNISLSGYLLLLLQNYQILIEMSKENYHYHLIQCREFKIAGIEGHNNIIAVLSL